MIVHRAYSSFRSIHNWFYCVSFLVFIFSHFPYLILKVNLISFSFLFLSLNSWSFLYHQFNLYSWWVLFLHSLQMDVCHLTQTLLLANKSRCLYCLHLLHTLPSSPITDQYLLSVFSECRFSICRAFSLSYQYLTTLEQNTTRLLLGCDCSWYHS